MVSASAGFRTAFVAASGDEVRLAPRLQLLAAFGPSWASGLSISLGGLYEREAGPRMAGRASPGFARERAALLGIVTHDLTPRWTAIGSFQADLPIAGLGRNEVAAVVPSIGVRYLWSMHD
jgi:hypothetical protein